MLSYTIAGESHGESLIAIVEGLPYKAPIDTAFINRRLARRNSMFGRSSRMKIENDEIRVLSGVRDGLCIGSPVTLQLANHASNRSELPAQTVPRPGHVDLPAMKKYGVPDARDFTEFASARLTAIRTAVGALAEYALTVLGVSPFSRVVQVGDQKCAHDAPPNDGNDLNCCESCYDRFRGLIDAAMKEGDTLGGAFVIGFRGVPAGIGSITPWHKRLGSRFLSVLGSIQTVKAVEFGDAIKQSSLRGSVAHGGIVDTGDGAARVDDISGGIEGGLTNGSPIVLRAYCKPVSTVRLGYPSIDVLTKEASRGVYERSDTCVVASCSLVAQSLLSFELFSAIEEQFHADTFGDFKSRFDNYICRSRKI